MIPLSNLPRYLQEAKLNLILLDSIQLLLSRNAPACSESAIFKSSVVLLPDQVIQREDCLFAVVPCTSVYKDKG